MLPIELEPFEDESALGWCLRCVTTNKTNLHWLRRVSGIPETHHLRSEHAKSIAHVLQCSMPWLECRLAARWRIHGRTRLIWFQHEIWASNHLRGAWPQLCPLCIHASNYCKSSWELSSLSICPIHQCSLIDECGTCGDRLRWDRPAIDICRCGKAFQPTSESVEPDAVELGEILTLASLGHTAYIPSPRLPAFLAGMSLGGIQTLIDALGLIERPYQVVPPSLRRKARRTSDWYSIVSRALEQLACFRAEGVSGFNPKTFDQVSLAKLADRAVTSTDSQVASLLLDAAGQGAYAAGGWHERQMPLFGDRA
jgi:hypothetical protein